MTALFGVRSRFVKMQGESVLRKKRDGIQMNDESFFFVVEKTSGFVEKNAGCSHRKMK